MTTLWPTLLLVVQIRLLLVVDIIASGRLYDRRGV
jgi:hypothetical protein